MIDAFHKMLRTTGILLSDGCIQYTVTRYNLFISNTRVDGRFVPVNRRKRRKIIIRARVQYNNVHNYTSNREREMIDYTRAYTRVGVDSRARDC